MFAQSQDFLRKLLPIDITSIPQALRKTVKDFGIINTIKIIFFVSLRFIKYRVVLSFISKKDELIEKQILDRKMLLRRSGGGISWDLLVNGIREKESTYFLREELKPGMNVLEAGANIGYYLVQEAQMIGQEGFIYAFEPDPNNIDLLQKNIDFNDVENVTLRPMALGNYNGTMDFHIAERGNLSGFTIKTGNIEKVEMARADDLLKGKRVDYVRMDVEGFELDILKGMEQLLKDSVKGMFIEIHPMYLEDMGISLDDFFSWLEERGFVLVRAFSDYDWNPVAFTSRDELMQYKYTQKMVWRSFFRKAE